MGMNFDASYLALAIVIVLLVDISKNTMRSYAMTNSMFLGIAWTTLAFVVSGCYLSISRFLTPIIPLQLKGLAFFLYYVLFAMLALVWIPYFMRVTQVSKKAFRIVMSICGSIYTLFFLLVVSTPWTKWMFFFDQDHVYYRGKYFMALPIVVGLYILATLIILIVRRKSLDKSKRMILILYPIISGVCVCGQMAFAASMWAATGFCFLLFFMYLNIQNRKLSFDTMTGIANRYAFTSKLEQMFKKDESGVAVLVALDNFKFFNQKFGFDNGDRMLKEIAGYLSALEPIHSTYRYSGDVFAIILDNAEDHSSCNALVRSISDRFMTPWKLEYDGHFRGREVIEILSAGIVMVEFPNQVRNVTDTISAIDFALVEAKGRGLSQIVPYDSKLTIQRRRRHEILAALNNAIKNDTFELYYQPVIENDTGYMRYAEAMLRLNDPILGWIPATELIPIAETCDMSMLLTYRILERICLLWNKIGPHRGHLERIAVNIPLAQLMDPSVSAHMLEIMAKHHIDPRQFQFDINENLVAGTFLKIQEVMEDLKNRGMNFALDDFGKGSHSLNMMMGLPFSFVKLDRSIINQAEQNLTIAESISSMFHRLEMVVGVKGVENSAQVALSKQLGIEYVQGYYYCCPVPSEELLKFIREDNGPDYRFPPRHCSDDPNNLVVTTPQK